MSGTYVTDNGNGEFEVRPFLLEKVCHANDGHQHYYDHFMRVEHGAVRVDVFDPDTDTVLESYTVHASDEPQIPCTRFNGEIEKFHIFIAANKCHRVTALLDNTLYACCFQHRDFETGEIVQFYNANPKATAEIPWNCLSA